nr:DUF6571 family protein [Actinomyces sp. ZJ308]
MEALSKYDWSWDPAGFAGLTAAVASVSSKRASTVESPTGGASESERAHQLTGVAIHELAANVPDYDPDEWPWQQSDNAVKYNGDAKANLGTLLANCAPELTQAWNAGSATDALTGFTTVATGGLSAPFQTGASLATTTLTTPLVTDEVFGANKVESTMNTNPDEQMWAYAVRDAANARLLDEKDFSVPGSEQYAWITTNSDGTHGIDLSNASQEDLKDVKSWTDTISRHTSTIPDSSAPDGQRTVAGDPSLTALSKEFMGKSAKGRENGIEDAKNRKG